MLIIRHRWCHHSVVCLSCSCIVLKRQKIYRHDFFCIQQPPCLSQVALKFGLHRSTSSSPDFAEKWPTFCWFERRRHSIIVAEWSEIAQWSQIRDVTEPANIRIHRDAGSMCKIRRIRVRMWIYRASKITSYYGYCNSTYLLKIKQLQTN